MPSSRAPGPPAVALATLALAVLLYPGALLRGEAFFERDLHDSPPGSEREARGR